MSAGRRWRELIKCLQIEDDDWIPWNGLIIIALIVDFRALWVIEQYQPFSRILALIYIVRSRLLRSIVFFAFAHK